MLIMTQVSYRGRMGGIISLHPQGQGFSFTTFFMLGKSFFFQKKILNISLPLSFSCSAGVFLERALNMQLADGNVARCTYTTCSNLAPLACAQIHLFPGWEAQLYDFRECGIGRGRGRGRLCHVLHE